LVKVQKFDCVQVRVSGCNGHYKSVLGAVAKVEERSDEIPPWQDKNRDKQLTFSTYDKSIVPRTISIIVVNYYS
jgi:hypothetical protein